MPKIHGKRKFVDQIDVQSGWFPAGEIATTEDFTISIDSVNGSNVLTDLILDQAGATAHGAFVTLKRAIESLPQVNHTITFSVVDGYHPLDTTLPLGDLKRITFGQSASRVIDGGRFVITSTNGLVRVGGTSTYAVASSTNDSLTLASDPGFTADAYQSYFIRSISGTGDGDPVRPIRTHTGTLFSIPPSWSTNPDGTTVIEFVEPAAHLNIDDAMQFVAISGGAVTEGDSVSSPRIVFESIDVIGAETASGSVVFGRGIDLHFTEGTRFLSISVQITNATLRLGTCVVDRQSTGLAPVIVKDNGNLRSIDTGQAWLIRGGTSLGIDAVPAYGGTSASLFIFNASVDGGTTGCIRCNGINTYATLDDVTGSGTSFGVLVQGGATVDISNTTDVALVGTTADFQLDNVTAGNLPWTDLDTAPDNIIIGPQNSLVKIGNP